MGQLARVRITAPGVSFGDLPGTMIVKLPTADPGGQFIGQMMRIWESEHRFYRDVAPHVNVRVPFVFVNIAVPRARRSCARCNRRSGEPIDRRAGPAAPGDHVAEQRRRRRQLAAATTVASA